MLELSTIPDDVLLARGKYSTIRAAHEDAKKELQILCGKLGSIASQVLRALQPDGNAVPESHHELIESGRNTLNMILTISLEIQSLAAQKEELRAIAWAKN